MRVLQTLALPLGDVAVWLIADSISPIAVTGNVPAISNRRHLPRTYPPGDYAECRGKRSASGAGDGTRTHDLLLGKEVFYQLNYARR